MQLQMTAPIDIGLEQQDAALASGQDDFFDLQGAEKGMKKKKVVVVSDIVDHWNHVCLLFTVSTSRLNSCSRYV